MGERGFDTTAEGVTPVTAQAKELLAQANLESAGFTRHRRGTQLNATCYAGFVALL
jgi:hypothetical protein